MGRGGRVITLTMIGFDQVAKSIRDFKARLNDRVRVALDGTLQRTLSVIRGDFERKSGLGRSLRRTGEANFEGTIAAVKSRERDGGVEAGIELKGLAAVIERGGRLRPHRIKGKPYLAFRGRGGRLVVVQEVQHPGGPVRAHALALEDLKRNAPDGTAAVGAAVSKLKAETFG